MSLQEFITGFFGASKIELIASVCGFVCVFLIIKRNVFCWFFGFVQVTLFVYIFFQSKLYSAAILHVIYMGLQVYGWWNWTRHKDNNDELIIEGSSPVQTLAYASIALITALIIGLFMKNFTDADFAYLDAFIATTSLAAQVLLTRRYLLNWSFWIVVNIVSIYVYLQQDLFPTSVLYACFLVMSVFGQISWYKQYKIQISSSVKFA